MPESPVQVFISYARDDNDPPPGLPGRQGFVAFLQDYLNHKFKNSGPLRPKIWRDEDQIADGEEFPQKLRDELENSAFLLVVLSPNWLNSDNCRGELEYFRTCRERRNEPINERIIVVEKYPVERPAGLPTAVGYKFYRPTDREVRRFDEFFDRGEPVNQYANEYWTVADDLFAFLLTVVTRNAKDRPPAVPRNGRAVFVAKPAADMREQYNRLVFELTGKGYTVVPDRTVEIPDDGSAAAFIDAELAKAELSIHLLGESSGWNIVNLQLACAAARVPSHPANGGGTANPPFQRIVWAPKVFQKDPRPGGETLQRDPHDVLLRFSKIECNEDKIFGEDFSTFRESLVSYLDGLKRPSAPLPDDDIDASPGKYRGKIYVLHDEPDRDLARRLRRALSEFNVEGVLPLRDGDEVERRSKNISAMRACDGVVVCWGTTTEQWAITQARDFENWRTHGREQNWEPRGIVVGPPPGEYKREFQEDGPPSEVNTVVWVQDLEAMPSDELRKLVPRRPPA